MGSEYDLPSELAKKIRNIMESFVATHNPRQTPSGWGPEVEPNIVISGHSDCRPQEKGDYRPCYIEFLDKVIGGYAYLEVDEKTFSVSASDFQYPKEYEIAKKMGIPIFESKDWCLRGEQTYCSKRRW